jgi:anti-sigma B factor antagonist
MKITLQEFGDVTVLELDGRLMLGEATILFRERVLDLLRNGRRKFVVDYSNIAYVDSAGNAAITKAFVVTRNAGGTVVIVGLHGRVKEVFEITQLIRVFETFPSVPDALAHFGVTGKNG